jgi:hypothetical protein
VSLVLVKQWTHCMIHPAIDFNSDWWQYISKTHKSNPKASKGMMNKNPLSTLNTLKMPLLSNSHIRYICVRLRLRGNVYQLKYVTSLNPNHNHIFVVHISKSCQGSVKSSWELMFFCLYYMPNWNKVLLTYFNILDGKIKDIYINVTHCHCFVGCSTCWCWCLYKKCILHCKTQIFDHSDSVFQLKHPFCTVYINDGKDLQNNLKPLKMCNLECEIWI